MYLAFTAKNTNLDQIAPWGRIIRVHSVYFQGILYTVKPVLSGWSHIPHCWKSYVAAQMGIFADREDPDEMLQNRAFYQGLHFLLGQNRSSEKQI